jgi:U32 family peptidase
VKGLMPSVPELLAPAGDRDSLAAALAAGADAVYLGLDDGFNARARAANFPSSGLADVVAEIHRAGARVFVTLNTLVFESELVVVEELVRRVAAAGADAIIVQDPAVAQIARAVCPTLEVHASTQMTASSPHASELLAELGIARVVVPRELSVDEIRAYAAGTRLPLEVFVHGALCVAWSGQCLSSEAWGGRSANRGQCAQACRLPYQLFVDGAPRSLGDVAYLLSPKDLVGLDAVPALVELGVASLKIEGRLKGPAYVATTVARYRHALAQARRSDDASQPEPAVAIPIDRGALDVAYSRGASPGFLAGADHQTLVEGRFPRHRGLPLGRVVRVEPGAVVVVADPAQRPCTGGLALGGASVPNERDPNEIDARELPVPRAGMGVVFDRGRPEEPEQGGPIFAVDVLAPDRHRLGFGEPGPDLAQVGVGDRVWITSDPRVTRAGEKAAEAGSHPLGRIAIELTVRGSLGEPLAVTARARYHASAPWRDVTLATGSPLAAARGAGLTRELVVDKLGALGGTAFHLGALDTTGLDAGLHVPVSELKELRRRLVAELDAAIVRVDRDVLHRSVIEAIAAPVPAIAAAPAPPVVVPLCRTDAQLDAVLEAGAREVELDWMELVGLGRAVERARRANVAVGVATVRVQKPGEDRIDAHLARLEPDHVLVRSWGSLAYFAGLASPPRLHGDFSLNVTNSITAGWVLGHRLATVAAAHDLDRPQLLALLARAPRGRIAVTIHHHIPTFHTEHCVYAHLLSTGRDFRSCGRPCERHDVALRDRVGLVHPVVVDVGCRNTVFNAQAQSAAGLVPELAAHGVTRFRIELVRETAGDARRLYAAYAGLVAGTTSVAETLRAAAAHEQFGVTRGTMRTLTVLP